MAEVSMATVAKLFRNGRSQAVRLPREFRFEGTEVSVRRDPATGDVILSPRRKSLKEFFDLLDSLGSVEEFMKDRRDPPQKRRKLF
jgi:antitoxin VapB